MCHRTVVHVQRAIEAIGIPTILITVEPTQTVQARAPRAVHPTFNAIGTPVGKAGDVAGHVARSSAPLPRFTTRSSPVLFANSLSLRRRGDSSRLKVLSRARTDTPYTEGG
jgi:hypothetical protein